MGGPQPLQNDPKPAETTISLSKLMNELSLVPGMTEIRARLINPLVETINSLDEPGRTETYENLVAPDFWVNRSHKISRRDQALSDLSEKNPGLDISAFTDPDDADALLTLIRYLIRHAYPDGPIEVVEGQKPKMPPIRVKTITLDS